MRFEWDPAKAASNARKHKVTFEVAKSVFYDDFAVQFFDEEHAAVEQQSAATSEISSTMQSASSSIGSINRLVGNIATAMDETRTSATRAADQVRTNIQAMVG